MDSLQAYLHSAGGILCLRSIGVCAWRVYIGDCTDVHLLPKVPCGPPDNGSERLFLVEITNLALVTPLPYCKLHIQMVKGA